MSTQTALKFNPLQKLMVIPEVAMEIILRFNRVDNQEMVDAWESFLGEIEYPIEQIQWADTTVFNCESEFKTESEQAACYQQVLAEVEEKGFLVVLTEIVKKCSMASVYRKQLLASIKSNRIYL